MRTHEKRNLVRFVERISIPVLEPLAVAAYDRPGCVFWLFVINNYVLLEVSGLEFPVWVIPLVIDVLLLYLFVIAVVGSEARKLGREYGVGGGTTMEEHPIV